MVKINKHFELNITVEPCKGASPYESFQLDAYNLGWKTSKFDHDDVDDIAGKWFATRHAETKGGAKALMVLALDAFKKAGYTVSRWKIEKIVFDSKHGSSLDDLA
jgi:hypothetical protein